MNRKNCHGASVARNNAGSLFAIIIIAGGSAIENRFNFILQELINEILERSFRAMIFDSTGPTNCDMCLRLERLRKGILLFYRNDSGSRFLLIPGPALPSVVQHMHSSFTFFIICFGSQFSTEQ
jgi:hypothetical protein